MHQLAHYDIRLKKCEICGLELRSNSHLNRHLRVHSGEKPFECPTCGQKFAQRYVRMKGCFVHRGNSQANIPTHEHFRYNMMTHYKGHQGIHRVQSKKKCTICTAKFSKQSSLDEHMESAHNSVTTAATKMGNDLRKFVPNMKKVNSKKANSNKSDDGKLIDIKAEII